MAPLGISHLQFTVRDPDATEAALLRAGYDKLFGEEEFDRDGKLPCYRESGKSLRYFRSPDGCIEIISPPAGTQHGAYVPTLGRELAKVLAIPSSGGEATDSLLGACEVSDGVEGIGFLTLNTRDSKASAQFWMALGAHPVGTANVDGHVELAFSKTLVTSPLRLVLRATSDPTLADDPHVDDRGCTMVTLLCKDLRADIGLATAAGGRASDPISLCINDRQLNVAFVEVPGGGLAEFLQPTRTP